LTRRRLGKYRVLERLGSGGMGEVYAAEDTSLGRRVALKVLRPEVAGSPERRQRFQTEARAVAALNHPGIVTLYSVEEADGEIFLTMELVEGRSLRELIRDGPLPPARAIALGVQLCDGLASAHAAGVLHRDLKPDNLIVTPEDRVKILDFGLAKLLAPATDPGVDAPTLSGPGVTVGTAGYMAPEQALGRRVDARADVFAVGVVLYQMVTGRAPFEGATPVAVFDHLLNRPAAPVASLNAAVPAALAAAIEKAMEKDPGRRHGSARELMESLREAGGPGPAPASVAARPLSSLAVLPFADLSAARDQEYLCHGVAEELIHALSRVPRLRVITRSSAFAAQGQTADVTEIGRRLGAGAALEGSVRRSGDRVRIIARLVSTHDGTQLWSKRFDRELADLFAVEDEIAETIVGELASGLAAPVPRAPAPRNTDAHDAYLQGLYALNRWTADDARRAIDSFRDAIARDPGFAAAHAGLAECYVWLYSGVGLLSAREAVPPAREAVRTALELDPDLPDAHRLRGVVAMNHDWDRRGAEDGLRKAIALGPSSATAHVANAWRLVLLEARYEEALESLAAAERLGPLDLQVKTMIGYVHYMLHDLDRAVAQFEKTVALDASFAFAHYALGDVFTHRGDYDRAFTEYETALALGGRSPNTLGVLGYARGRAGQVEAARALLAEIEERAADSHVSPMWPALVHLGLGDHDAVFGCLERAFEERDGSLVLVTAAIEFVPLRTDPRLAALLERMGLGHLARPAGGRG
jgi:serine/threonine protein kinase/Tfp pilus assembly protein PilF